MYKSTFRKNKKNMKHKNFWGGGKNYKNSFMLVPESSISQNIGNFFRVSLLFFEQGKFPPEMF